MKHASFWSLCILLWMLCMPQVSDACSGDPMPVLGADNYPDIPFNHFASGRLGILTPSLATSYLFVAYRYLNNLPLSSGEQTAALTTWEDYFSEMSGYLQPVYPLTDTMMPFCGTRQPEYSETVNRSNLKQVIDTIMEEHPAWFRWRKIRQEIAGLSTEIPVPAWGTRSTYSVYEIQSFYAALALDEDHIADFREGPGFNYLVLASERLLALKQALGRRPDTESLLKTWIQAQQSLFMRTVDGSKAARTLLSGLPDNLPPLIKDDIRYSIAASYLYEGTAESAQTAAKLFSALADSDAYPWREWARYLQYRALNIAVNTLSQEEAHNTRCGENTPCRRMADEAENGMQSLSQNAESPQVREAAADYVNVIRMRTPWKAPGAYDALLTDNLRGINKKTFADLITLSRNVAPGTGNMASTWLLDVQMLRNSMSNPTDVDLVKATFRRAYHQWQNNPQNLAWLWLAVYTMHHADLNLQHVLTTAVLRVPSREPAFIPLRAALIAHFDNMTDPALGISQKRSMMDETLAAMQPGGDFGATKFLLNARAPLAASLSDLLDHAFFYPKGSLLACVPPNHSDAEKALYDANYIAPEAASIISALPASMLLRIAGMRNLPENYRPALYANLWTRSILFQDTRLEKAVSAKAMQYNPVLRNTILGMQKTRNPDTRKTLFLGALLHYPNLSPMVNLSLYKTWPGDDANTGEFIYNRIVLQAEPLDTSWNNWLWKRCETDCKTPKMPSFLTPAQQKEYKANLTRLNNLDTVNHYIGDSLIALANRYPKDEQYAELLALFIKYTRYADGGSRNAFMTLKKRYPDSRWAIETRYWY